MIIHYYLKMWNLHCNLYWRLNPHSIRPSLTEKNKELVHNFAEDLFNRHDLAAVDKYMAGAEGFKQYLEEYFAGHPDSQTRIDQIWITKDLKLGLKKSDIEDMELCTESDHNLIWAKISLDSVLSLGWSYTSNRQKIERKIFLYKDVTKENWEDYTGELEKPALTTVPDSGTSKTIHVPGESFTPGFQPRASGLAFASVLIYTRFQASV